MIIAAINKSRRAYTLVEVIISTCIVALFAGAVINSINYGLLVMQVTRENQRATQIILEKFETLRLYSWSQVNSSGYIPTTFTNVYDPQSPTSPGISYFGTVTPTNFPGGNSYRNDIKQFVVTVNWTTSSNIRHTRTVSTLVARDGEQNYVW